MMSKVKLFSFSTYSFHSSVSKGWSGHLNDQETYSIMVNLGNSCCATAQAKPEVATKYMVKKKKDYICIACEMLSK